MNFKELKDRVEEINSEMDMCYYEVMLVLDICDVLVMESNVEYISDDLFNTICECVKNNEWSSDEFSENVWDIIISVQDYSTEEIEIEFD